MIISKVGIKKVIININNNINIDTNDIENFADFLVYDQDINYYHGFFMAAFIMLCNSHNAITENYITKYFNDRVYFKFWSQNSLPALKFIEKFYFDALRDTICFKEDIYGATQILTLDTINKSKIIFSGANTKSVFLDFLRDYKCLREKLALMY